MKVKFILLEISLVLIMLFSVSCVFAADANDTVIVSENEIPAIDDATVPQEVLLASEDSENLTMVSSDESDLLGEDDDGTFTALQKKIIRASSGDTITLERDYTYDDGFLKSGILIQKDLTIDGKGHKLDGASKARIFNIMFGVLENHKVTLKNIKFVNGNTKLYGGAIFNYANLTLNNCVFTNNHADNCGGAINSVGSLTCNGCTFTKNSADGDAGAVFSLSFEKSNDFFNIYYEGTTPEGNMEFSYDLAINETFKPLTDQMKNCVFNGNVAKGRGGGAIYAFDNINIDSCTFNYNKAGERGGAVFANKDLFIKNSKFLGNRAPVYGGAVYFKCHAQTGSYIKGKWVPSVKYFTGQIQSSTFTKNTASKGGAVYGFKSSSSDSHSIKVMKCTFTANKASPGRDVYGGTTSNCIFNYLKLILNTVSVKKSSNAFFLTATVKKGVNPIKFKVVSFKFNGKTYKAKTNSKGVAKVTISKAVLNKLNLGQTVSYQVYYAKMTVKKTAKVTK